MKRFRFVLEPLLRHRRALEEDARHRYALRQNEYRAAQARVEAVKRAIDEAPCDGDIRTQGEHREALLRALSDARAAARDSSVSMLGAQEVLTGAMQACRVLDSLKDKRLAAYRQHAARREDREVEEIALSRVTSVIS